MGIEIRDLNTSCEDEINLVVIRSMETVLETVPEFQGSPGLAQCAFPNFSFDQMKAMFVDTFDNPDHRILVAEDLIRGLVLGHSIFSIKTNPEGALYGFCFSRFVAPDARQRGIGSRLLIEQEKWWKERSAQYALAQTHVSNIKLQQLFQKHGFVLRGPIEGKHYDYFELRKSLIKPGKNR